MSSRKGPSTVLSAIFLIVSLAGLAACDPRVLNFERGIGKGGPPSPTGCRANPTWLPITPPPHLYVPPRHPEPDCPFYQDGFQNFLLATAPDGNGDPAFASYATIDDLFTRAVPLPAGALAPAGTHRGTPLRAWLGNIKQAGARKILIDQDGHTLYYGIHVNQAFVDFVNTNGLQTASAIQGANPNLSFPPGVVALKSAWKDIGPPDGVPGDYSRFITTTAWVASLWQDQATKEIVEDKNNPRFIRAALIALHVAHVLPGHPEFVWTTFEHVDAAGNPDVAPSATGNPTDDNPFSALDNTVLSVRDLLLYHGGTARKDANLSFIEEDLTLDEGAQSFNRRTTVCRAFPGSKLNDEHPDDEVVALNDSVAALFNATAATRDPADQRGYYRLVGGLWMDKPELFRVDSSPQNEVGANPYAAPPAPGTPGVGEQAFDASIRAHGTDSPYSILAGEDRLSSTAMESFTQFPGSYQNCIACHNTQAMNSNGVPCARDPNGIKLLDPKKLNVSHVLSQFLLEECMDRPVYARPAFCQNTCN